MGERKVLNRYFPPDFDPAKLPKRKRAETNDMKVRMMLPMSVRCKTCGNFMYKGTKFNTRKEDVLGETYLGIQIFRFYYRCTNCAAEFTMKTDPQNCDYQLEQGATRNYEAWREAEQVKVETKQAREEEEMGNAMKALENRTLESKREMDIMAALDEMRTLKSRQNKVSTEEALAALQREADSQAGGAPALDVTDDLAEFYRLRRQAAAAAQARDDSSEGDEEDSGDAGRSKRLVRGAGGAGVGAMPGQRGGRTAGVGVSLAAAALEDETDRLQEAAALDEAGIAGEEKKGAITAGVPAAPVPSMQAPDPLAASLAAASVKAGDAAPTGRPTSGLPAVRPQFKVLARPKAQEPEPKKPQQGVGSDEEAPGLPGLLGGYGSSSSDSG